VSGNDRGVWIVCAAAPPSSTHKQPLIASNWVGFAVHTAIAFFLTPFVLASLGEVRYGVWALVIGLTGYYGILDLGFRQGMTQYMTRYLAARDFEQLNRTASTTWVALASTSGPMPYRRPAGAFSSTACPWPSSFSTIRSPRCLWPRSVTTWAASSG